MNHHSAQPVLTAGAPLADCRAAAILIHGRGRTPDEMIALVDQFAVPGVAYVAPTAADRSWYPQSFLAPIEQNEPFLSDALAVYAEQVAALQAAGVPTQKIVLVGFSQGACLTAEFAFRNPAPYGGIVLFTGGLIGPQGVTWASEGTFAGAPVFIGGADNDPFVPAWRMRETATVFRSLDAEVVEHIYPSSDHLMTKAEIETARAIIAAVAGSEASS
jgi:predicted esterase